MGDCFDMGPNGWSLNSCEALDDGREVRTSYPSPWRRWLCSDEHGRGSRVSAGVGLAKEITASHPRRSMGPVGLLTSPRATKALMTVLERSSRSGDARWIDRANTRHHATLTDGKDGQVSSRGVLPKGVDDRKKLFSLHQRSARAAEVQERGINAGGCRMLLVRRVSKWRALTTMVAGASPLLTRALSGHRPKAVQTLAQGCSPPTRFGDVEPHPDARVGYLSVSAQCRCSQCPRVMDSGRDP
jgi:hypothetical protein